VRNPLLATALFMAVCFHTPFAAAAGPEPKLRPGDTAPDFTLRDQNGKEVSLRDFRGKKTVVLAFYVFAFTGG
jgi:cytochrome oxidase Cu insertion factor (SCO1/SenC/PrrC family)